MAVVPVPAVPFVPVVAVADPVPVVVVTVNDDPLVTATTAGTDAEVTVSVKEPKLAPVELVALTVEAPPILRVIEKFPLESVVVELVSAFDVKWSLSALTEPLNVTRRVALAIGFPDASNN